MAEKGGGLMGYEKFGSDQSQIAGFGGAMQSEDGTVLLSDNSLSETALMMGPALTREVISGISNGDWAIGPQDPLATITDTNPLPYWSFTDTSSAGAITAAIVADSGSASGNGLRFTVASGTTTGKVAQISRYFPIPSSKSRSLWQGIEVTTSNITSTANAQITARIDFYSNDQATQVYPALHTTPSLAARTLTTATITTAAAHYLKIGNTVTVTLTSGPTGYAALNGTYVITNTTATTFTYTTATSGTVTSGAASGTITVSTKIILPFNQVTLYYADNSFQIPDYISGGAVSRAGTPPANAAYARLVISIETIGTVSSVASIDINEVRNIRGFQEIIINDSTDPLNYTPAYINNSYGILNISTGFDASGQQPQLLLINGAGGGTINATTGILTVGAPGSNGTIKAGTLSSESISTSKLTLKATGSDVIFQDINVADGTNPRILFQTSSGTYNAGIKSGAVNVVQILSGSTTTTYGQLWAARIYPMNGATASRYIYDDGTYTHFTGAIWTDGTLNGDALLCGNIPTTTATTNAGIWVLNTGTNYTLRRSTSSARFKTNIVDTDATVLEAARKIKPRHYESTIPDEAGETRLGFIAEEVEATGLTHAVGYNADGQVETLDPTALIAALYARVNDLEQRLQELENR